MCFLILLLLFPVPLMFLFSFLFWFLCNLLLSFLISSSVFSLCSCSISSVSQLLCCFLFRFLSPSPFSPPCQVFCLLTHFCSFSGLSFLIPYPCPLPFCCFHSYFLFCLISFVLSCFLCCFLIPFIFSFLHLFSDPFPVCSTVSCNLYYIPNTSAVSSPVS